MSSSRGKNFLRVLLLGIFAFAALYPGRVKLNEFNSRARLLEEEISRIKRDNDELKEKTESFRDDPFYLEKQARELGLTREGEKVFRIKVIEEDENEN